MSRERQHWDGTSTMKLDLVTASDAALVVAVGRFHAPALAETYRRHGGAVRAIARRVLGSDLLADEVTQDVFLSLWRSPERYDASRSGLRSYLIGVAHHRAVDLVRAESSRSARERRHASELGPDRYDVEHLAWDLATAEMVRRALDSLPVVERDAIELAYFQGRTYREVAALLDEPEGTVKSRIRSGLRRMQTLLLPHRTDEIREAP